MSLWGRLNSVTNGSFQVSEFNDSFPAMNLKSRRSPSDPLLSIDWCDSMAAIGSLPTVTN